MRQPYHVRAEQPGEDENEINGINLSTSFPPLKSDNIADVMTLYSDQEEVLNTRYIQFHRARDWMGLCNKGVQSFNEAAYTIFTIICCRSLWIGINGKFCSFINILTSVKILQIQQILLNLILNIEWQIIKQFNLQTNLKHCFANITEIYLLKCDSVIVFWF